MSHRRVIRRLPSVTLVIALGLAAYLVFVLSPLAKRADSLDKPLAAAWERLAASNRSGAAARGVDLDNGPARFKLWQDWGHDLEIAAKLASARVRMPADIAARVDGAFQLVDFQNDRSLRIEQITALAKAGGVALEPPATVGFPDYTDNMPSPGLLWARLHLAHQLMLTAIQCKLTSVRSLAQVPGISHRSADPRAPVLHELPMKVELVGSMDSAYRFLAALPLLPADLKELGLPDGLTNKPAFFLGSLMVRKGVPERPQEVVFEATVSGFMRAQAAVDAAGGASTRPE